MPTTDTMKPLFRHGEAFCLMWYACDICGHKERIWNSRDGVTPFGTRCPTCGEVELMHIDFRADHRVPEHKLHPFQKFWRNGTKAEALAILERRFEMFAASGQPCPEEVKASLIAQLDGPSEGRSEFADGWPTLDIFIPREPHLSTQGRDSE